GLRTPTVRIVSGAVVAIILVLLLWPKPPGIPPQSSEPLPINYSAVVGFTDGGDRSHLDRAVFRLPTDAEGIGLTFKTLAPAGLDVLAGTKRIASLEASDSWRHYQLLVMPRAVARTGASVVELDNLGWSPANGPRSPAAVKRWAVAKMWVARVQAGAALPARLADQTRVIAELAGRINEEPEYLYQVLEGLRGAAIGFMKLSGREAALVTVPAVIKDRNVGPLIDGALREIDAGRLNQGLDLVLEAMGTLESEVERQHKENMNALEVLKKRMEKRQIAGILSVAIRQIPEPTDPRHREIRDEVGKLDKGSKREFDKAVRKSKL
ncbi:MAG: hypothetical protein ACREQ9_03495, partial [Candidatus Binatia bacterium]